MHLTDLVFALGWPFAMSLVMVLMLSYLGFHVLERGVIFVDLALAQISALGVALAVLWGIPLHAEHGLPWTSYLVSIGLTIVGAGFFSLSRVRRLAVPQEALIGICFGVAAAATEVTRVLASLVGKGDREDLEQLDFLFDGRLQYVFRWQEVAAVAAFYAVIGMVHFALRKKFMLITENPDKAYKSGLSVKAWDFAFYVLFGLVISAAVRIIGILLVFTYLIVTAVIGALFARKTPSRLLLGAGAGVLLSALGTALSFYIQPVPGENLPTAPTIVVTFGAGLMLSMLLRHRLTR